MNHLVQRRSLARPAFGAAAALAFLGVALVQVGWGDVLDPRSSAARPSTAALLVIASLYLVASGWFYLQGAMWAGRVGQTWWPRRLSLFCDGMVCGVVLAITARGHQSGVLGLGLWTVPPVLLTFSGISGALNFLTWNKRAEDRAAGDGSAGRFRGFAWVSYVRVAAAVLLLVILIVVEIGGRARATYR